MSSVSSEISIINPMRLPLSPKTNPMQIQKDVNDMNETQLIQQMKTLKNTLDIGKNNDRFKSLLTQFLKKYENKPRADIVVTSINDSIKILLELNKSYKELDEINKSPKLNGQEKSQIENFLSELNQRIKELENKIIGYLLSITDMGQQNIHEYENPFEVFNLIIKYYENIPILINTIIKILEKLDENSKKFCFLLQQDKLNFIQNIFDTNQTVAFETKFNIYLTLSILNKRCSGLFNKANISKILKNSLLNILKLDETFSTDINNLPIFLEMIEKIKNDDLSLYTDLIKCFFKNFVLKDKSKKTEKFNQLIYNIQKLQIQKQSKKQLINILFKNQEIRLVLQSDPSLKERYKLKLRETASTGQKFKTRTRQGISSLSQSLRSRAGGGGGFSKMFSPRPQLPDTPETPAPGTPAPQPQLPGTPAPQPQLPGTPAPQPQLPGTPQVKTPAQRQASKDTEPAPQVATPAPQVATPAQQPSASKDNTEPVAPPATTPATTPALGNLFEIWKKKGQPQVTKMTIFEVLKQFEGIQNFDPNNQRHKKLFENIKTQIQTPNVVNSKINDYLRLSKILSKFSDEDIKQIRKTLNELILRVLASDDENIYKSIENPNLLHQIITDSQKTQKQKEKMTYKLLKQFTSLDKIQKLCEFQENVIQNYIGTKQSQITDALEKIKLNIFLYNFVYQCKKNNTLLLDRVKTKIQNQISQFDLNQENFIEILKLVNFVRNKDFRTSLYKDILKKKIIEPNFSIKEFINQILGVGQSSLGKKDKEEILQNLFQVFVEEAPTQKSGKLKEVLDILITQTDPGNQLLTILLKNKQYRDLLRKDFNLKPDVRTKILKLYPISQRVGEFVSTKFVDSPETRLLKKIGQAKSSYDYNILSKQTKEAYEQMVNPILRQIEPTVGQEIQQLILKLQKLQQNRYRFVGENPKVVDFKKKQQILQKKIKQKTTDLDKLSKIDDLKFLAKYFWKKYKDLSQNDKNQLEQILEAIFNKLGENYDCKIDPNFFKTFIEKEETDSQTKLENLIRLYNFYRDQNCFTKDLKGLENSIETISKKQLQKQQPKQLKETTIITLGTINNQGFKSKILTTTSIPDQLRTSTNPDVNKLLEKANKPSFLSSFIGKKSTAQSKERAQPTIHQTKPTQQQEKIIQVLKTFQNDKSNATIKPLVRILIANKMPEPVYTASKISDQGITTIAKEVYQEKKIYITDEDIQKITAKIVIPIKNGKFLIEGGKLFIQKPRRVDLDCKEDKDKFINFLNQNQQFKTEILKKINQVQKVNNETISKLQNMKSSQTQQQWEINDKKLYITEKVQVNLNLKRMRSLFEKAFLEYLEGNALAPASTITTRRASTPTQAPKRAPASPTPTQAPASTPASQKPTTASTEQTLSEAQLKQKFQKSDDKLKFLLQLRTNPNKKINSKLFWALHAKLNRDGKVDFIKAILREKNFTDQQIQKIDVNQINKGFYETAIMHRDKKKIEQYLKTKLLYKKSE